MTRNGAVYAALIATALGQAIPQVSFAEAPDIRTAGR